MGTVLYVIDYPQLGRGDTPRKLHRTDCPHPYPQTAFRAATADELRQLEECRTCAAREAKEAGR
jgi:hypothetical protein